jgi:hypothetical protein
MCSEQRNVKDMVIRSCVLIWGATAPFAPKGWTKQSWPSVGLVGLEWDTPKVLWETTKHVRQDNRFPDLGLYMGLPEYEALDRDINLFSLIYAI